MGNLKIEFELTPDDAKVLYEFVYWKKSLKKKYLKAIEDYLFKVAPDFFDD